MAARGRGREIAVWVVSGLLALLFVFSGGTKLAGMPMHVEHFAHWGYPDWFRLVVGAVEVVFGVGLLLPRVAFVAAIVLCVNMAGAVYTELFRGDPATALFPLVLLVLLVGVASVRRSPRMPA